MGIIENIQQRIANAEAKIKAAEATKAKLLQQVEREALIEALNGLPRRGTSPAVDKARTEFEREIDRLDQALGGPKKRPEATPVQPRQPALQPRRTTRETPLVPVQLEGLGASLTPMEAKLVRLIKEHPANGKEIALSLYGNSDLESVHRAYQVLVRFKKKLDLDRTWEILTPGKIASGNALNRRMGQSADYVLRKRPIQTIGKPTERMVSSSELTIGPLNLKDLETLAGLTSYLHASLVSELRQLGFEKDKLDYIPSKASLDILQGRLEKMSPGHRLLTTKEITKQREVLADKLRDMLNSSDTTWLHHVLQLPQDLTILQNLLDSLSSMDEFYKGKQLGGDSNGACQGIIDRLTRLFAPSITEIHVDGSNGLIVATTPRVATPTPRQVETARAPEVKLAPVIPPVARVAPAPVPIVKADKQVRPDKKELKKQELDSAINRYLTDLKIKLSAITSPESSPLANYVLRKPLESYLSSSQVSKLTKEIANVINATDFEAYEKYLRLNISKTQENTHRIQLVKINFIGLATIFICKKLKNERIAHEVGYVEARVKALLSTLG